MPTPRDEINTRSHIRDVNDIPRNNDIICAYLDHKRRTRWSPRTAKTRSGQVWRIAQALEPTPLALVTEDEIIRWHDALEGTPETRAAYTSAARGLFNWMAVRSRPRIRVDDPSQIIERPHIPQAQPRPMLTRHYQLALACALSDPELYLWLGLMGCSGLRCCEIAWMHTSDVEQLEDGTALLHITGKGQKQRTVPAGSMLVTTLQPFLRGRGPVFTRPTDGLAYQPAGVSQRVNKFLHGIGIDQTAHQLRHRFGTDYHAIDTDVYRQAAIMGHASVNTTKLYTAVHPLDAARYVEALTRRQLGGRADPRDRWAA